MKVALKTEKLTDSKAQLLILPVLENITNHAFDEADTYTGGALTTIAKREKFKGQAGRTVIWGAEKQVGPERIIAVGIGSSGSDPAPWRTAIGRGIRYAAGHRIETIAVYIDATEREWEAKHVKWVTEALHLAVYRFNRYKSLKEKPFLPKTASITFYPPRKPRTDLRSALVQGEAGAMGVSLARDLVNEPANILGPKEMARRAKIVAQNGKLKCRIIDAPTLKRMGANLLLGVGEGSSEKPRLVHLTYKPAGKKKAKVALIGKGITFDSGGLCLKPGKSMAAMKTDMAGAAIVLGVMSTLHALAPKVEIHGIIPLAENAVGSRSIRPGDVFTSLSGLSVEIINTDAEGRLVLADAMTYAAKTKPDIMVDYATLTGACTVALGLQTAGLFSNTDTHAQSFLDAAIRVGEGLWRLPLCPELKSELKSPVADIKNVGGRYGGAISAALFLERFTKDTPWIHVDIAGPARADKASDLCPKGGTGFGVLTLLEFLGSL